MQPLATAIQAVTVYPDRAHITRQGTAAFEPGTHQLEITDLPLQMISESLRTSARGTAKARLLGAQVQRRHYVDTPSETIRTLEEQVEALQVEIATLDNQAGLIKEQRTTLDKIAGHSDKFALALASGEMQVEQELAIFDALRGRAAALDSEALALQARRKGLDRQLTKLVKDLEGLRNSRPRERYAALVELEVLQAGELTVELVYMVRGAEWKPAYDLRLVEEQLASQCEVTYLAQVTQKTGEPWEGVRLSLSTARPALSRGLPELQPWYIRPPLPPMPRAVKAAPFLRPAARLSEAMPEADAGPVFLSSEFEAEAVTAEVEASGTSVTYNIPVGVSIPPDGTAHKVTVARFKLPPQLDYLSAPRLSEAVYRRARLKNDSPYTLLSGEASLFVKDEYIGSSPLARTAPQGEIELALGIEDRLKVKRELKRREVDKRLISGRRHLAYGYELRLENLLPFKAELRLHDQFPVPRHEEIKVKLEACEPRPAEQTELNVLKWELSLEPGEKRTLRFDFSVESPQGMEIAGLP